MSNAIHPLVMPKWGLTMVEGTLTQWHVPEGAEVGVGDVMVDIETSKIANELEADEAGILRRITASAGETLPVGMLIGVIAPAGVAEDAIDAFITGFVPEADEVEAAPSETPATATAAETQAPPVATAEANIPDKLKGGEPDNAIAATIHARKLAGHWGVNLNNVTGTGRRGRISKQDLITAIEAAGGSVPGTASEVAASTSKKSAILDASVKATPSARQLAGQLGISLADLRPTGPRGRATKADVEAAAQAMATSIAPVPAAAGSAPVSYADQGEFTEIPLSALRRTIAARLVESKRTAPHFRLIIDLELDDLLALRQSVNATDNARVSLNDMLVKAVAQALVAVPEVNIQFDGEIIRQFKDAHVAVAVALDEGLITPILRSANRKGIVEISEEAHDLAERARKRRLMPDEFEGGTFTISNLGMFGIREFDAIINPPQAAILAVGSASKREVLDQNGDARLATVLTATLSCDHRVIDGVTGARFLSALKGFVEAPDGMLL